MKLPSKFVLTVFAAAAVTPAWVAGALALDGYWHGVRSLKWCDGVNGGDSNWYDMAPASGNPQEPPDGMAIFAPGAQSLDVDVDGKQTIEQIQFAPGNEEYDILVDPGSKLNIQGPGVQNDSSAVQLIAADTKNSQVIFKGKSKACITPGGNKTLLGAKSGGIVFFTAKSLGGKGCAGDNLKNGTTRFIGRSSAGKMLLKNRRAGAAIQFLGRSTGGKAKIKNQQGSLLFASKGPKGNRKVTAKSIDSRDKADIGVNEVSLSSSLKFTGSSNTTFRFTGAATHGAILAKGTASVGGKLVVKGNPNAKTGTYTLIRSNANRAGTFGTTQLKGFGTGLKASINYTATEVQLVLKKS